ncbi:MAG: hypothetical protein JST30_10860 [Armatimonadetes bacterium]|nr:hypothetical protein [Armatimonadota bacterium]
MADNPIFVDGPFNMVKWYYRAPISELRHFLCGPEHWIVSKIMPKSPKCTAGVDRPRITFRAQPDTWNEITISGTCGLPAIDIMGRKSTDSGLPVYDAATAAEFWRDFEDVLAFVSPKGEINIDFIEGEAADIHMQVGSDKAIHAGLMFAVAVDQKGFIDWLLRPKKLLVKRSARYFRPAERFVDVAWQNIEIVPKVSSRAGVDELSMTYDHKTSGGCTYPCVEVACNGFKAGFTVTGTGTEADPFKFRCELLSMLGKPYCVNPVNPQVECPA